MRFNRALPTAALAAAMALLLSGCVVNEGPTTPADAPPPAATEDAPSEVNDAAAELLPAAIKEAGTIRLGVGGTYPPNEFKDDAGKQIGWSIELAEAMAARLGVTAVWKESTFDNIIPSVTGGTLDLGVSSFTDTVEREKQVDFVNYYIAGILWASPAGKTVDPDNACGLTVAVKSTTFQDATELPAKNDACVEAGKPPIKKLKFNTQDDAVNALVLGRADAMSADSPITEYAVAQTDGKLQVAGTAFDVAPYGIAVAKGADDLVKAVQLALQSMVDDGSYLEILERWSVSSGAVTEITVNAGANG